MDEVAAGICLVICVFIVILGALGSKSIKSTTTAPTKKVHQKCN